MKETFLILTGGTLKKEFLTSFLEKNKFDYIICVDGALKLAEEMQLSMDYLVGDFDTVDATVLEHFLARQESEKFPVKVRKFQPERMILIRILQ